MSGTGITWSEFYTFLTKTAGCTEVGWHPGTHVTLKQPNGVEFGTCKAEKSGYVSIEHFVAVANTFGKNRSDMEIWMGRRPAGKSKMTAKRAARPGPKATVAPEKVAEVYDLAQKVVAIGTHIGRSGVIREKAKQDQRRALQDNVRRLEAWVRGMEGGAA